MMIIGIVRYAIPNAFKDIKENDAASKTRGLEKLYEEPYFTDRFNIFCNITLKSFANQTDKNFVLCVYHTDQIPETKKQLFDKIEQDYPFVRCVYVPDDKMPIPEDIKEQNMLTFRIDNDDGVPIDFIERLRKTINTSNSINFAITIPKIRKIMRISDNNYKTITANYPSNSMGLAYYTNEDKTIIDLGNHTDIHVRFPTKKLSGNGGLQIINSYNVANKFDKKNNNQQDRRILNKKAMESLLLKEHYSVGNLSCLSIVKEDNKIIKTKKPIVNKKVSNTTKVVKKRRF